MADRLGNCCYLSRSLHCLCGLDVYHPLIRLHRICHERRRKQIYVVYFWIGGYLADIYPINTLCYGRVPLHAFIPPSDFYHTDASEFIRGWRGCFGRLILCAEVGRGGGHQRYRESFNLEPQVLNIRNRPTRTRAPDKVTTSAVANQ